MRYYIIIFFALLSGCSHYMNDKKIKKEDKSNIIKKLYTINGKFEHIRIKENHIYASFQNNFFVWDISNRTKKTYHHVLPIVAFNVGEKYIYITSIDRTFVREINNFESIKEIIHGTIRHTAPSYNEMEDRVFFDNTSLQYYELKTKKIMAVYQNSVIIHKYYKGNIYYIPSDTEHKNLVIKNIPEKTTITLKTGHKYPSSISIDNNYITVSSYNGKISYWSTNNLKKQKTIQTELQIKSIKKLKNKKVIFIGTKKTGLLSWSISNEEKPVVVETTYKDISQIQENKKKIAILHKEGITLFTFR